MTSIAHVIDCLLTHFARTLACLLIVLLHVLKLLVFEQKSISTGSGNSSKPKSMARYARKSFLIKYLTRCLLLCCRNMAADFRSESKLFPKDPSFPLETFSSQLKTQTTNAGGLQTTSKYENFKLQSLYR